MRGMSIHWLNLSQHHPAESDAISMSGWIQRRSSWLSVMMCVPYRSFIKEWNIISVWQF